MLLHYWFRVHFNGRVIIQQSYVLEEYYNQTRCMSASKYETIYCCVKSPGALNINTSKTINHRMYNLTWVFYRLLFTYILYIGSGKDIQLFQCGMINQLVSYSYLLYDDYYRFYYNLIITMIHSDTVNTTGYSTSTPIFVHRYVYHSYDV